APIETASESLPSPPVTETPTSALATRSSAPIETASESLPSPTATETATSEFATTSSAPIETPSESQPSATATADTSYASDESVATATPPRATYQVIGIPQGDYLNVREGAGADYHVVTTLEPGTGGILLGTRRVANGDTTWQEITVHGQTGWVNAAYIGLETQVPTPPTRWPAESSATP